MGKNNSACTDITQHVPAGALRRAQEITKPEHLYVMLHGVLVSAANGGCILTF